MVNNPLIMPCEVAVKSVVPAVKALMAQELVEKHGLKQDQVAEILGISQSAVSKYTCKVRGYAIRLDDVGEIQPLVGKMVTLIMNGVYDRTEFLSCFCQTCMAVRKTGLMCQFCQKSNHTFKMEQCDFCLASKVPKEM
jgi:predicted transcriptional regulator